MKVTLNLILTLLLSYSIYLIFLIPQPYGIISLTVLCFTFLFNFIKNRKVSIPLYALGVGGSLFVLVSAYNFNSYTDKQRDRFNIPTAVNFEKGNFKSALVKAKLENKHIFIDFYTSWCAPCLSFTRNVLTNEEVGNHMNRTFINLKYDAEKGEGVGVSNKYNVNSYPTLLIIDYNGNVVENVNGNMVPQEEDMIRLSKKYNHNLN